MGRGYKSTEYDELGRLRRGKVTHLRMLSKQHPRRSRASAGLLHLSYILQEVPQGQSDTLPHLPVTANVDSVGGHSVMRVWTCRSALQIFKRYMLCLTNELLDLVHLSLQADKRKIRCCH